ncbi:SRPBCC family protein [Amycolatopsis sp. 195334CR]|uniref:SRPBCC family protein n=1 Tax=Amycolatopsis sp. 195334CR TaxID=2814588 RepID=UPI001A8F1747|nr:SRPBCC family protein [Amycolatopsis sp. 195334CR]MBN6033547.1 SRPBCC family protein [Amycolatopsis sp. 195334CR]
MRLDHRFTVPAPVDEVWQAVLDPERVAPCMPGATLTEVDGDAFSGTVKVKLGPISLTYKGKGEFLEKDAGARRVVIKAAGKDARGAGTAAATVTVTLHEEDGATVGEVATDLKVTGRPAQFGRGMIGEVGGKILDSFASCLATKLGGSDTPAEPAEAGKAAPAAEPGTAGEAAGTGKPAAASKAAPAAPKAVPEPEAAPAPVSEKTAPTSEKAEEPAASAKAAGTERPKLRAVDPVPEAEPIDLVDYAGASVAKRLIPVAIGAAVIAGVVVIIRALKR